MRLRSFRGHFALGLMATALLAIHLPGVAADEAASLPNIVFIMADDLGYSDIGVYGARDLETPSIDTLARDGVMLTQAYANSSICSPTRTALITGRYQQRIALGLEEPLTPWAPEGSGIPANQPTIASVLRDRGYETALVGKWHLGEPPEHGPLAHGYDHFFGIVEGAADYFRHHPVVNGENSGPGLYRDNDEIERLGYLTDLLGDEAVRRIQEIGDKPLFLSLHFTAPHWPWEGREDQAISDQLANFQHQDGGNRSTYETMVEQMDENIAKVLAAISEQGIADNTIVVFTSDNGGERYSDTWPFTGVKGELLEGGIRVPLVVRWPGRIDAGSRSDQVMISMDFLPTFLAAAGGEVPADGFDGIDLLPQLLGEAAPVERTLFWRFKSNAQAAVRQGDWKYLKLGDKEFLFNLAEDSRERAKLQDKYPDKFTELKALWEAWNAEMLPYPEQSYSEQVKNDYPDRY